MKEARAGSILVRINSKYYEIPNIDLFKTKNGKDVYLSGLTQVVVGPFKSNWKAHVKFIEENIISEIDLSIIERYMSKNHKKLVVDNQEYDIPSKIFNEVNSGYNKIHKKDIKSLNELKKNINKYIFK